MSEGEFWPRLDLIGGILIKESATINYQGTNTPSVLYGSIDTEHRYCWGDGQSCGDRTMQLHNDIPA